MAKGNPFMGSLSGKMGDVIFYRRDGEQILRPRIRNPRNPRTTKQMAQRALIGTTVRFFNRGTKAFFKFAFENKKRFESDFNAFIKVNNGTVPPNTKSAYDANMPAIGNYILTQGTLSTAQVVFSNADDPDNAHPAIIIPGLMSDPRQKTVGELSQLLCNAYNLKNGDRVTVLGISHPAHPYDNIEDMIDGNGMTTYDYSVAQPIWNIQQFTIDTRSTSLGATLGIFGDVDTETFRCNLESYANVNYYDNNCFGFAVVFSRGAGRNLKVSYSRIENNAAVKSAIQIAMSSRWFEFCANSFGSRDIIVQNTSETILEGSASINNPTSFDNMIPNVSWYPSIAPISKTRIIRGFAMEEFNSTSSLKAIVHTANATFDVTFTKLDNNTLMAVVGGAGVKFNRGVDGTNFNMSCLDVSVSLLDVWPYEYKHNGTLLFYREHIKPFNTHINKDATSVVATLQGDVPEGFTQDTYIAFYLTGDDDTEELVEMKYVSPTRMVGTISSPEFGANQLSFLVNESPEFELVMSTKALVRVDIKLSAWNVGTKELVLS